VVRRHLHWSRGALPFDSIGAEAVYLGAGQNSTRIFVLPAALGLDVRMQNGYVYISPIPSPIPRRSAAGGAVPGAGRLLLRPLG
jgi:pyruvate,water dikinase